MASFNEINDLLPNTNVRTNYYYNINYEYYRPPLKLLAQAPPCTKRMIF